MNLCSNPEDKLQIYRDNFEKAYLDSTERFYRTQAPSYLQQNGVQNYMKYVRRSRTDRMLPVRSTLKSRVAFVPLVNCVCFCVFPLRRMES